MGDSAKESLENIMLDTTAANKFITETLKKMRDDNDKQEALDKKTPPHEVTSETRIRKNMVTGLAKKFQGVLEVYHGVQAEYSALEKARMKREMRVVNPDTTDQDLERLDDMGAEDFELMMQDQVMGVKQRDQMQSVVAGIEEKHREVQKIE